MALKFNPTTAQLDLVGGSGSGVQRVGNTTDKSITRWVGTNADTVQGSKAIVQDGGAVQAQAFVGLKNVTDAVNLPVSSYAISTGVVIQDTGSVTIDEDSQLIII